MKQNELPTDVSLAECGQRLLEADDIYILSHQYPDGDTLGSAAALCRLLLQKGKRVRTLCSDEIPKKFADLYQGLPQEEFSPAFVVAVDVADVKLLGKKLEHFGDKIDLCIDHHGSNKRYARWNYVDPTAAAAAEMIAQLANLWGVALDPAVADAIFTGITTDTGCFKYTNATSRTYRIAADMIDAGADASRINRIMFDTKSRARLEIERRVLDTMRFYFDGRCAVVYVTNEMVAQTGAGADDTDGLASLPRQVEGVKVGVTLRQREDGAFKASVRTDGVNASAICAHFGGGGHPAAAGCLLPGTVEQAREAMLEVVGRALEEQA